MMRVKDVDLAHYLDQFYVRSIRESIHQQIMDNSKSNTKVDDDVVSINEDDFIGSELPEYEQELRVWNKKRRTQRNMHIQVLLDSMEILC